MRGKKWAKKIGQKVPKSAKKSQNSFSGLGRPCLRAGPKGQPQARRRCGPEGPAPEAPRLPAEGRQASIFLILFSSIPYYYILHACNFRVKGVKTEWVQVWANSIRFAIYAVNIDSQIDD